MSQTKKSVEIARACFNQGAAKTADQLVVVVARRDLWRSRAKANYTYLSSFETPNSFSSARKKWHSTIMEN